MKNTSVRTVGQSAHVHKIKKYPHQGHLGQDPKTLQGAQVTPR